MAIGVGFDRIHAYSSPRHISSAHCSSSPQCLGQNRMQNPTLLQSSPACFFSPSFLQLSLPGSRSSSVARANKNHNTSSSSSWRRAKKCRQNLERNSLFGSEVNCASCSATKNLVQRDRNVVSKVSASVRDCESSLGCCSLANGGADGEHHQRCFSFEGNNACSRRRPARRAWTIARCEAAEGAGGGVSYDDGIATVNNSGTADGYGGEAGSKISESRSDSDTSLITNGVSGEDAQTPPPGSVKDVQREGGEEEGGEDAPFVLKEILRLAQEDLENCKQNSKSLEENAQRIAEKAFALKDEANEAESLANGAASKLEELVLNETRVLEEVEKATASKAVAEDVVKTAQARLDDALSKAKVEDGAQVVFLGQEETDKKEEVEKKEEDEKQEFVEAKVEVTTERTVDISVMPVEGDDSAERDVVKEKETTLAKTQVTVEGVTAELAVAIASSIMEETEALENAKTLLRDSEGFYKRIEAELSRIQSQKENSEEDVKRLREAADRANETAFAADEDVARAMAEAEQAVAVQLEAAQRVGDAEVAYQKAGSKAVDAAQQASTLAAIETEKLALSVGKAVDVIEEELEKRSGEEEASAEGTENGKMQVDDGGAARSDAVVEKEQDEVVKPAAPPSPEVAAAVVADKTTAKESEPDNKKVKEPEQVKESPLPKSSKKRSSRFFAASYFSSEDGEEFSPGKAYAEFATSMKSQLGKVVVGIALLFAGGAYMNNRMDNRALQIQPPAYTTSIDQANANTKPIVAEFRRITKRVVNLVNKLPAQEVSEEEASLFDVLWLLLASVIFVPLFTKIPGGSPVLGYLVAGVLIGPHTIHIIQNVHGTKAIAEFGVVFLLFNIGLELSVERLSSMKKYVFGLGTAQVCATAAGIGVFLSSVAKITGPPAIIIASGLALSSTAVVLQVLQERGESTSRHGRATFSVLLFQDLAVVVLLILIPLLSSKGGVGLKEIGAALGVAGIKAVVAIVAIIASGRLFLRPIYKQMADNRNAEIFAANTLLVVLGTSVLTARAGLSMALGAFLAGLLLAETEFALQVESDIAPYRGLLLGLFFMTVGMSIDPKLLVAKFPEIASALALLIVGKTLLVALVGRLFGLTTVAAVRTGLLLAPGGEFAFVAFGEAVNQGIMSSQLSSLLFLVVGLSMAFTPWLAAGGQVIAARFEQQDVRSLLPQESETDDLKGHIIICGFGRVGQIIAQLLSERLIPFVALDVRSDRVSVGRQLDLPVYFGDAGSKEVLHKVGAERAAAAVITLDTPGANYRTVWALCKHFPGCKTFVRAHDVQHGLNLEKAGATAVVPETLEPSLQLAAAVLSQAKVPAHEIASAIDDFRGRHLSELTELSDTSGTSLGYGFSKIITKPLLEALKIKPDDDSISEMRKDGTIVAVP